MCLLLISEDACAEQMVQRHWGTFRDAIHSRSRSGSLTQLKISSENIWMKVAFFQGTSSPSNIAEKIAYFSTVQTFNSCTSRPDVCQCLVVQIPMDKMSKNKPSTLKTHNSFWIKSENYVQLRGHPCIHAKETGLQSGVRSCIKPRLPTHLVQELNVNTVDILKSIR